MVEDAQSVQVFEGNIKAVKRHMQVECCHLSDR
jgi:hypothetical protein